MSNNKTGRATKALPFITINLDKPRKFAMNIRTLMAFEQETGSNLITNPEVLGKLNLTTAMKLIWCGVNTEEDPITFGAFVDAIDTNGVKVFDLIDSIDAAADAAFPDAEPGDDAGDDDPNA